MYFVTPRDLILKREREREREGGEDCLQVLYLLGVQQMLITFIPSSAQVPKYLPLAYIYQLSVFQADTYTIEFPNSDISSLAKLNKVIYQQVPVTDIYAMRLRYGRSMSMSMASCHSPLPAPV